MYKSRSKYIIYVLLSFLLFSFISTIFFIRFKYSSLVGTVDMQFHVRRLMELKNSISHGIFFPHCSLNYFHGSAVMSMYPYINLYPFVLILFLTHSVIKSYYIFVTFNIYLVLIISYFSSLRYSESKLTSYLFSITYGLSSAFIYEFFGTGDLGIATSLVFLPLIIFGYIDIINGSNNYLKLTSGITLVLCCQIPSLIISICFISLWSIINYKFMTLSKFINIIKSVLLSICLTSIIWVPFFTLFCSNDIHTVDMTNLLQGANIKFFLYNVGFIIPIAVVVSILNIKKLNIINRQMLILGIFILVLSSKIMPWKLITSFKVFKCLNKFQFASRFLIIPNIIFCYLFADIFSILVRRINTKKLFITFFIVFVVFLQCFSQFMESNHAYYNNQHPLTNFNVIKEHNLPNKNQFGYILENNKSIYYLICGYFPNDDYWPSSLMNRKDILFNNRVISLDKSPIMRMHNIGYNTFMFKNSIKDNHLILPLIHYNHEQFHVYLNHHLLPYQTNKYGLIELNHVRRGRNVLNVKYIPNKLICMIEFIVFLIGILWITINLC